MIDIVLIDKKDKIVGYKEKYLAHKNPVPLHRAISVVILSKDQKRMLLQQRPDQKPTWPLFWSNTCCTHPFKNENYKRASKRRLFEEMGFKTPLKEKFRFIYKAKYNKIWGEHELDVVFTGVYDGKITPNKDEVADYRWVEIKKLLKDIKANPTIYTPWFKIILEKLYSQN